MTDTYALSFKNIISVSVDKNIVNVNKGLRIPGLATFNKWSGTFISISKKEKNFWNVTRKETPLVFELSNEKFNRIIIGVDNADEWATRINGLISQTKA